MKMNYHLIFIFIILFELLFIGCPEQGSSSGGGKTNTIPGFQNTWINLNPSTKPSARFSHSMVYAGNNKIILFGGDDSIGICNGSWEYK